ncbi:hypothetical protein C9382_21415 [Pseudomonas aylmerensis]|uniref:Uncharacterized protein n=1 Tax=Pseudomonas aylmerensis TaxID=1869229 RepID=A0A2T4FRP3_9PSED|nr:hypothetical protein C9382_21415 [Pseudomonas aylmerensis]
MQSSGGIPGSSPTKLPTGDVMSFLACMRSLTEQVRGSGRLMIEVSVLRWRRTTVIDAREGGAVHHITTG